VFNNIPKAIAERMRYLERMDAKDREDGTPRHLRLRQIPPETGKFIAMLAAASPKGSFIEVGTSAGYSTLWLTLACREVGNKITTFEWQAEKAKLAEETFKSASVEEMVELIVGDAREYLENYKNVSFCFLDVEKELYQDCYEAIIPNMVSGGILVADNVISHNEVLKTMVHKALNDKRVDALVVPIGKGELVCRKI
jgi:caffeoyl-CoA O-methyltransferase